MVHSPTPGKEGSRWTLGPGTELDVVLCPRHRDRGEREEGPEHPRGGPTPTHPRGTEESKDVTGGDRDPGGPLSAKEPP